MKLLPSGLALLLTLWFGAPPASADEAPAGEGATTQAPGGAAEGGEKKDKKEKKEKEEKEPKKPYDGPIMNQTLRFGLDYQFRSAKATENPYYVDENGQTQFVEMRNGGHSLGLSMEGWTPFGTLGLGILMPAGGSVLVGDSDTGTRFKYRNATVWNFHIGPGLMNKRGLGIYAGFSYKYHHLNFKDDVTVPGYTVQYVSDYFFARSTGPFVTVFVPLGKTFLLGGDVRAGGMRMGFGGEREIPPFGRYNEASLILFPHSSKVGAEGLYIRIGAHSYNLEAANGEVHRTGGHFIQFGGSFTSKEMTKILVDTNNAVIPPPSDPP